MAWNTSQSPCPCDPEPSGGRRASGTNPSQHNPSADLGIAAPHMILGCQKSHHYAKRLRMNDNEAVLLLLNSRASPSRREEGNNDPIFIAIQMSSAVNVRRLLQYSADPRSREATPTRERHAGRRRLIRRTALDAAAAYPQCHQVIRDFITGTYNYGSTSYTSSRLP